MRYLAFRSMSRLRLSSLVIVTVGLAASAATAQVTEPNGTSVPAPTTDPISLQQFFTMQGESINAVADARITPATFQPLCNFEATLVLRQSSAGAGLAWYNVPSDATSTPTVNLIGTAAMFPPAVGSILTSSDIRSSANYTGGLIGFALMKNLGSGPVPVYYSEDMRNADCTGCTMPGYWKMALMYQSTVTPNSYYMAWEDWEGANSTSWQGNDGDFNDQVFQLTGVTCEGSGVPCPTDLLGVCANGVTQCQVGGGIDCIQQIQPSPEKCDNLDNDCNGQVDDGDGLCPGDSVCVNGTCVSPCGSSEFSCFAPYVCMNGLCVDSRCSGVTCMTGQVCQAGVCVGGCDGVMCPHGQQCQLGVCVDPCANVTCQNAVCVDGACVTSCECQPCASGQVCASSGACVDDGCETVTCPTGQFCRGGSCIDSCDGAACPGGADCHDGVCDPPPPPGTVDTTGTGGIIGGTTGTAGTGGSGTIIGTTGQGGSPGVTGGVSGGLPTGSGGAGGSHEEGGVVSCACEAGGPQGSWRVALGMLLGLALGLSRRRPPRRRD